MLRAATLGLAACFLASGCGGSSSAKEEPDAPTLENLWRAPGEDVAITPGSADFGPGAVRLTFLIIDGQGGLVTRPAARIWIARGLEERPFAQTTARLEEIGVEGSDPADAEAIFVTKLQLQQPGTYWLLAEPVGGRKIQAVGTVVVKERTAAPDIGAAAPRSQTPTLATATIDELSTSRKPDPDLYRSSVADALAARAPFVVVFATPKYCASRTCGPVVDVVSTVRRGSTDSRIRFIHVEIYEDNDPAKDENRWVKEWKLPSEPWVFVVGADGKVRDRFEGTVSVRELGASVQKHLTR
ncbi:MAG: hypothetical protein H0T09_04555 [Actinobacteria bacterium]|nr:hypothetical protein [Actinomycetota bacterium]